MKKCKFYNYGNMNDSLKFKVDKTPIVVTEDHDAAIQTWVLKIIRIPY